MGTVPRGFPALPASRRHGTERECTGPYRLGREIPLVQDQNGIGGGRGGSGTQGRGDWHRRGRGGTVVPMSAPAGITEAEDVPPRVKSRGATDLRASWFLLPNISIPSISCKVSIARGTTASAIHHALGRSCGIGSAWSTTRALVTHGRDVRAPQQHVATTDVVPVHRPVAYAAVLAAADRTTMQAPRLLPFTMHSTAALVCMAVTRAHTLAGDCYAALLDPSHTESVTRHLVRRVPRAQFSGDLMLLARMYENRQQVYLGARDREFRAAGVNHSPADEHGDYTLANVVQNYTQRGVELSGLECSAYTIASNFEVKRVTPAPTHRLWLVEMKEPSGTRTAVSSFLSLCRLRICLTMLLSESPLGPFLSTSHTLSSMRAPLEAGSHTSSGGLCYFATFDRPARLAQSVERTAVNRKVDGSIPSSSAESIAAHRFVCIALHHTWTRAMRPEASALTACGVRELRH
ncbi:hypothetical protein VOLCADRAFT_108484 [Volvox carteri f. nagariensis]|uniref:Uncharacterized protein n=1 Tax=Volvox carteri f. nagariensis TaxID=3068 RepID=D8UKD9_VOLCA|nr:uncharacterized protein VOLCADRAFT_108484 [Volvox carteri f. nagariensis]EFJ39805.1 hypothetical protein VOLCADRAFT_108484 [Volvox carteri f. nagariensis]|eukprot:XP_002959124.1 hypothetical protein VOLCADRAFT_108484 [Volvox carteri f. nagariensis]